MTRRLTKEMRCKICCLARSK